MFKIGEFSKLSNITVRSLRHYESLGLLEPEKTDTTTGYRYYSARQLETAKKIRMFRDLGFSLESIRGLLNAGNLNAMRQYYELRQIELEDELQSIRQRKDKLSLLLNNINVNKLRGRQRRVEGLEYRWEENKMEKKLKSADGGY